MKNQDVKVCAAMSGGRWPAVSAILFLLAAAPALAESPESVAGGPPRTDSPALIGDPQSAPAENVYYINFDSNLEGWYFLNHPDTVQEYYPDQYTCDELTRMRANGASFALSWGYFDGSGAMMVTCPFRGWYRDSCYYSWRIKSVQVNVPDEWDGLYRVVARVYKGTGSRIWAKIGYRPAGSANTYYLPGWSELPTEGWTTLTLSEPSQGAFADLDAVSILFGAYSSDGNVYVDWVQAYEDQPDVPVLVAPANDQTIQANLPTFQWTGNGDYYTLQVATDPKFTNVLIDTSYIYSTSCKVTRPLPFSDYDYLPGGGGAHDPHYYWRVKAHRVGPSGVSLYSNYFQFIINGPHEVPSEYPSILAARGALPPYIGGTVLVAPGTYTGRENCSIGLGGEKPVDIIATGGAAVTVIDCQNTYYAFSYDAYTAGAPVVEGFTIRNARADGSDEAAIVCRTGAGTIRNCIIENGAGTGVLARSGGIAYLVNTEIRNQTGDATEATDGGRILASSCRFIGNDGYGGRLIQSSAGAGACSYDSCLFADNGSEGGGGLYVGAATSLGITNSTFTGNVNGIEFATTGQSVTTIANCLIAFSNGRGIDWTSYSHDLSVLCSDAYGNGGGDWVNLAANELGLRGNIQRDPLFCDATAGDYRLAAGSPCAAEYSACGGIGLFGIGCILELGCAMAASDSGGPAPWTISFSAWASRGQPPYSYHWDFGDGGSGSSDTALHTYTVSGVYTVRLTVTDQLGATCEQTSAVQIGPGLSCTAAADPTSGPAPLVVSLQAAGSGGVPPYRFSWAFGDGGGSTQQNPIHEYSAEGVYTCSLAVFDQRGYSCTSGLSIVVGEPLQCAAAANPARGPAPLTVNFSASASG
ncbi:MAG TPA: PKD domain-containing protein, partial [candidate division Zixibacteria bacterium]|nr:PKD domain-containing protein [candidate division Zixibacteria bacterium]